LGWEEKSAANLLKELIIADYIVKGAIKQGLHKASEKIKGMTGIKVLGQTVRVDNNQILQYCNTMST